MTTESYDEAEKRLIAYLTKRLRGRTKCSFHGAPVAHRLGFSVQVLSRICKKLTESGQMERDGPEWWVFFAKPKKRPDDEFNEFEFQTALALAQKKEK